ncbi:unnamed protein product [Toxocara canis]|uniref:Transmembrane protein n=1 Tax=Toxocara canis TaxID=6265 RepID=A0A183UYD6_TOXCA|nr:unnamed protein product [Toxocara canis]
MGHKVNDLESDHDNGIVLDHNNGETHSFSNPSEYASKYPHEDVTQRSEESETKGEADPNGYVFIYALGGLSTAIGVVSFALGLYTAYAYLRSKKQIAAPNEQEESVADTTDLRSFPVKEDKKIDDKNESNEQKTKAPNVHNEDESSPDRNPVRLL